MTHIKVNIDRLKQMDAALKESGWVQPMDGCDYIHSDYRDEHVQKADKRTSAALTRVDELIDVLGLRDQYPDVTTQVYRPWNFRGLAPYYETVTTYGREQFMKDIHAAHQSSEGAEALNRIRSVLGKK